MCKPLGYTPCVCNENVIWDICTSSRPIPRRRFELEHIYQGPKDGELCPNRMKPEETLMEVRIDTDVQIVRHILVYGAKDYSNHLVTGFLRSFPQDSWS